MAHQTKFSDLTDYRAWREARNKYMLKEEERGALLQQLNKVEDELAVLGEELDDAYDHWVGDGQTT